MSMRVVDSKIILKGKTAKNFNYLAKNPNAAVIRKKERYLHEINTTIDVEKRNKGVRITVK